MMTVSLTGDWNKLQRVLAKLLKIMPVAKAKLYEDGKVAIEQLQGHIDSQDLPWKELSDITVRLKQDERVYLDTGGLKDSIGMYEITSNDKEVKFFVGASPYATNPDTGERYSDIMLYMEYGTATQVGRPLVQPTYEDIKGKLRSQWKDYFSKELLR